MSDEIEGNQVEIEQPEIAEYQQQQHIKYKHKQQVLSLKLHQLIRNNLSQFNLIMNGLTYAYTKLTIINQGLQSINQIISQYTHLRIINLSYNLIQDISYIEKLQYLIKLDLNHNSIKNPRFLYNQLSFPYLKILNLSNNKIEFFPNILLKNLIYLNINYNSINTLQDFQGHKKIQILELRCNKINNLKGLSNMPKLKQLYLAENNLNNLQGLNQLTLLNKIHLRKNKFISIEKFPIIPTLKYLNLRQNGITKVDDLQSICESVVNLNLLSNPISEQLGDNTRKEIWMKYRQYDKINKMDITIEEKQEFDKEYKDKLAEIERERLEKQLAQKEARETAEKQAEAEREVIEKQRLEKQAEEKQAAQKESAKKQEKEKEEVKQKQAQEEQDKNNQDQT